MSALLGMGCRPGFAAPSALSFFGRNLASHCNPATDGQSECQHRSHSRFSDGGLTIKLLEPVSDPDNRFDVLRLHP
jgi:hypothetical protein